MDLAQHLGTWSYHELLDRDPDEAKEMLLRSKRFVKRKIFAVLAYKHERYGTIYRAYLGANNKGNEADLCMTYDVSWYAGLATCKVEKAWGIEFHEYTPDPAGQLLWIGGDSICSASAWALEFGDKNADALSVNTKKPC